MLHIQYDHPLGVCHEIFNSNFFLSINPSLAPDKQVKLFSKFRFIFAELFKCFRCWLISRQVATLPTIGRGPVHTPSLLQECNSIRREIFYLFTHDGSSFTPRAWFRKNPNILLINWPVTAQILASKTTNYFGSGPVHKPSPFQD